MDNMEKLSTIKDFSKLFVLSIGTDQASEPVISDHQGWDLPQLAKQFQHSLGEHSDLFQSENRVPLCIAVREYFLVVQEIQGHIFHNSFVDTY